MTRRLARHLSEPGRKRRILALDGGGVRGFLTIEVLQQLEFELRRRSGDDKYTLSQYFDLIGGTSTGSIIATGLALGWSVSRVWAAYELIVPEIFGKASGAGLLSPRFRNKPLAKAFLENFEQRDLESPDLETGLAIFAKRMDRGSAWMMVNNPGWCYYDNQSPTDTWAPNRAFELRSIVQASAAAPHFFRGVKMKIEHTAGKKKSALEGHFVDGGVAGLNNPALELLTMVRDPAYGFNWDLGADKLYMLSVGTGWIRSIDRAKSALGRFVEGLFIKQTVNALRGMINDVSLQQVAYMQALGQTDMRWFINSEKRYQADRSYLAISANAEHGPLLPLLHYQRVDVRLEEEKDHNGEVLPESPSKLIGRTLSSGEVDGLNEITNSQPANLELLKALGEAAGKRFMQLAPPPAIFNPDPWTRTGEAAPTRLLRG
ncbi:MAG: patatin-like phospholipase family protein [Hyphomonadaceae bacterium]|nr:patatin-like phospholipase family protein [Hyphomonadaceae bacterium]